MVRLAFPSCFPLEDGVTLLSELHALSPTGLRQGEPSTCGAFPTHLEGLTQPPCSHTRSPNTHARTRSHTRTLAPTTGEMCPYTGVRIPRWPLCDTLARGRV